MARLFCIVALLVTVIAVTQAAPALDMSEKEDLLRLLLERKGLWDWWNGDEETTEAPTTTQVVTTTEEPEPALNVEFSKGTGATHLTSGQICGMAQSLFPRSENVKSKRDLIVNMIYHLCLPSVGPEDVEAIALILDFLRGEEQDVFEPVAPTTPEPEDKPSAWDSLIDKLAAAKDNTEGTGEEEGVAEEAATPAAPAENEGEPSAVESGNGADASTDTGADAGAETGADADTGAETDAGAAGADAGADTGATGDAGAGADGEGGPETAPAKRMEDAEFLKLLLKAVENNTGKRYAWRA